jgi:hypothetical protein
MTTLSENRLAKPWYREPWPWLLMSGPIIVVIAGFFTLWLAVKSDDGLVADDYYKRGLAINQMLSRATRAEQLAMGARAELGIESVRLTVTGAGVLPDTLRVRLVHPTRAVDDQVLEVRTVSSGVYAGALSAPIDGRRVVILEDLAKTWRLAGEARGSARFIVLTAH